MTSDVGAVAFLASPDTYSERGCGGCGDAGDNMQHTDCCILPGAFYKLNAVQ